MTVAQTSCTTATSSGFSVWLVKLAMITTTRPRAATAKTTVIWRTRKPTREPAPHNTKRPMKSMQQGSRLRGLSLHRQLSAPPAWPASGFGRSVRRSLHHPCLIDRAETEPLVEPVGIGRPKHDPNAAKLGMLQRGLDEPHAEAAPAVALQDAHVGQPPEAAAIRDYTSEADFSCAVVQPRYHPPV